MKEERLKYYTPFKYEVRLIDFPIDKSRKKDDKFLFVYNGKEIITDSSIFVFVTQDKLSKSEAYKVMEGTMGIETITGDFGQEKYYIPELSEFHVGFEYEYQEKPNDEFIHKVHTKFTDEELSSWVNISIDLGDPSILAPIFYRVKYLDKEDIESLGFKYINDNYYRKDSVELIIFNNNPIRIVIEEEMIQSDMNKRATNPRLVYYQLFDGIIKNKSVFKQVLKMIGVL